MAETKMSPIQGSRGFQGKGGIGVFRASKDQFPLTFRGVKYRQQSAAFPNKVSSFNPPIWKEDLKWFLSAQNPVTLNRWRAGFCILFPGESARKRYGNQEWD